MPTPEEKARLEIDRQLGECGWIIQDRDQLNIAAGRGVAVREFPTAGGEADYLLYADERAIGVIEAKPEGTTLIGVEGQSRKYVESVAEEIPAYGKPLPIHYESTGKETRFTSLLDPVPRSRPVFTFHRPEELVDLVAESREAKPLRQRLREFPELNRLGLWEPQERAILNLERSLGDNRPRALVQMVMGAGKTFTACSFIYRLIKFANAKRVLYLVDRSNLGRQTVREFQNYRSPYTGHIFTDEFNVQHLKSNRVDPVNRVCITTIQRLYSILQGKPEFEEENEEESAFQSMPSLHKDPVPVAYNPAIPIGTFDFIVIDECHRSIYNLWRQVLEYFDGFLIGLTATPTKQTIGFFNNNLVMEYTHEQAVADGINVGYDVYSILTKITGQGARLDRDPEILVPHRDRKTREKRYSELDNDLIYTGDQLDRDVVNRDQIRLVIRTFKERLFTEIFPDRTTVPKTLVFAKDDSHAEDITEIIREEFGEGYDFCQKITYKTTGKKPEDLLQEFRNSFNPRIAVTVDMIATGTDVKSLECLLFMRTVKSASYFEQMKGRGVRVIDTNDLVAVTPDAKKGKDRFVIVDAVGVCHEDKTESKPLDRQPLVSFEKLLEMAGMGVANPDLASALGARLARLDRQLSSEQRESIPPLAQSSPLRSLVSALLESVDPDAQREAAVKKFALPEAQEPDEKQMDAVQVELIREALKPFHDPKLRKHLVSLKKSIEQVIDEINLDELLDAGYNADAKEKAKAVVQNFETFIRENKDELEAIRLLYSKPWRAGLRFKHLKELAALLKQPPTSSTPENLWRAYTLVQPERVKGKGGKIPDLIALVRHALTPEEPLIPVAATVGERFAAWLKEKESAGISFTSEQRQWLEAIRDHIASSLRIEQDDFSEVPFSQRGGLGKVHELFGDRLPQLLDELNARLVA